MGDPISDGQAAAMRFEEMAKDQNDPHASKRAAIQYAEYLRDREEEYDAELRGLEASGDRERLSTTSQEFGQWRMAYRQQGEKSGLDSGGGVRMSTNLWHHWGIIAFDAEASATAAGARLRSSWRGSDPSDELGRSFRASMSAIVAAAFIVEGLYGAVCYYLPYRRPRRRWSAILLELRQLFDLSSVHTLDQRMERLFALRDDAAHPWERLQGTLPHPDIPTHTSIELVTYAPDEAIASVTLACTLLDTCTLHPVVGHRSAVRWARDYRPAVERLLACRSTS